MTKAALHTAPGWLSAGERPYQPALDHGSIDWESSTGRGVLKFFLEESANVGRHQLVALNGAQTKTSFIRQLWMRCEPR
jgi:hypothetical protein